MSENTFEALLGSNLRIVRTLVQRRLGTSNHADDIVQEILLRAFQRRNQLRTHAKFRTWLWSIALNEIRAFYRRSRSTVSLEEVLNFEAPDPSMPPLLELERMERRAWVHACMAKLSERDQATIRLRDIEDNSVREAAAACKCSESAVKTAHFRARHRLAQIMASTPMGGETQNRMSHSRLEL
jgi:RNA polymerase sigma-70 factor (ECF subfamily)